MILLNNSQVMVFPALLKQICKLATKTVNMTALYIANQIWLKLSNSCNLLIIAIVIDDHGNHIVYNHVLGFSMLY